MAINFPNGMVDYIHQRIKSITGGELSMAKSCGAFFFSWLEAFQAGLEAVGGKDGTWEGLSGMVLKFLMEVFLRPEHTRVLLKKIIYLKPQKTLLKA